MNSLNHTYKIKYFVNYIKYFKTYIGGLKTLTGNVVYILTSRNPVLTADFGRNMLV